MLNKIANTIALHQNTINEIEQLKEMIELSVEDNVRFRVETKYWYGYGIERHTLKEKSILDLSKYTMQVILDEAIIKERERIDKLIDMEIEERKNNKYKR